MTVRMHGSDLFQSGYPYKQPLETMGSLDYTCSYSEENPGNDHSPGFISVSDQGISMSRKLSNDSHSSDSTYKAISPQTSHTGWMMDPSTGSDTYYNYADQDTDTTSYTTAYTTTTDYTTTTENTTTTDYTTTTDCTTTAAADDSSWYSQGSSYSPAGYYASSQGGGYSVDTTVPQSTMGADIPRTTFLATTAIPTISMPSASTGGGGGGGDGGDSHPGYMCLLRGCESKTLFKRKADLQRHYQHRHTPNEQRKQYLCDYKKCVRAAEPFHRVDHFRDHYRVFHSEDLTRKTGEQQVWYNSRNVSTKWWRCAKCLGRTQIAKHGWVCPKCGSRCDDARRRALRGYE